MSDMPTVSVIVLSYKHVKYIRKCIDSILAQKVNFDIEIVVGDDNSNDGTKEILLAYKEKHPDIFKLIIKDKNEGAAKNGYDVRKACRGKYVANMESDDFWCDENKLQKQVDYLEAHPECSAVGANYYVVFEDDSIKCLSLMPYECDKQYSMNDFFNNGFVIHTNTLLYRNIIPVDGEKYEKVRFCVPTMGDVFQRLLLYDKGLIYCFPEPMLSHRLTPNTSSSFQAAQKNNANKYTDMMFTITENADEYFEYKYNCKRFVYKRMSTLLAQHWLHEIRLDKKGFNEQKKRLDTRYRITMPFKAMQTIAKRGRRALYRKTHKKEMRKWVNQTN